MKMESQIIILLILLLGGFDSNLVHHARLGMVARHLPWRYWSIPE